MDNDNTVKGIYKITNSINNKTYIGQSKDIYNRWKTHKEELNTNKHHSYKLQEDWNEYGADNFKFEIIKQIDCSSIYDLCLLVYEDNYIKLYDSVENGYNCEYTLEEIFKGNKEICEVNQLTNIYNLMLLNNNELPNNIKEFVLNNTQYFNYIDKTYQDNTIEIAPIEVKIFAYLIKDEYKTLKCDYISVYNENLAQYLLDKKCRLLDEFSVEDFPKTIYRFKADDYEKHYLDWIILYNTHKNN